MKALTFQNITLSPAKVDNQIWLTSTDIAQALGYSQPNAVTKLYNQNADEFRSDTTQVIDNPKQKNSTIRIFSLRGCHLIAMFARTKVAKEFRQWVLDILDKEVGEPTICTCEPRLSDRQAATLHKAIKAKCRYERRHYQRLYNALYDEFDVRSYKAINPADYQAAMDFVRRFELDPIASLNLPAIHSILTDQIRQNREARSEIDGLLSGFRRMLEHIDDLQSRLHVSECNVAALQRQLLG
ncbi:ORF6C domain-containing protein [Moraxella nasibovis]|uniref:BRO-N domain-containing protein n=1 Tax=Moraxella nasibovis TaxID=2904120 RepID=UPI00240FF31E|nr:Bro-N domain-containing protein [Moraxella nasibovis]WFF38045.1 ORF6C domain-containing protein [Moraxella nasibovis]